MRQTNQSPPGLPADLESQLREISLRNDLWEIRINLDMWLSLLREPGPQAADLRLSCAQLVLRLAEKSCGTAGPPPSGRSGC